LTFKENLLDYASQEDIAKGEEIIKKALEEIEDQELKKATMEKLELIEKGQRDLYF
jgi:2-iminoacetate synthase